MKTALILFEQSGTFLNLYKEYGYNSIAVDLKIGIDILDFDYKSLENVDTIIAHPPCTEFAVSGARWWKTKSPKLLEHAIKLVRKSLEIIDYFKPRVWFIENPVGRIEKCVPELQKMPKFLFNPNQYALYSDNPSEEAYTKKTILWGQFTIPPTMSLPPILGSKMHYIGGWRTPEIQELRSVTPQGFAKAFVLHNIIETSQLVLF